MIVLCPNGATLFLTKQQNIYHLHFVCQEAQRDTSHLQEFLKELYFSYSLWLWFPISIEFQTLDWHFSLAHMVPFLGVLPHTPHPSSPRPCPHKAQSSHRVDADYHRRLQIQSTLKNLNLTIGGPMLSTSSVIPALGTGPVSQKSPAYPLFFSCSSHFLLTTAPPLPNCKQVEGTVNWGPSGFSSVHLYWL